MAALPSEQECVPAVRVYCDDMPAKRQSDAAANGQSDVLSRELCDASDNLQSQQECANRGAKRYERRAIAANDVTTTIRGVGAAKTYRRRSDYVLEMLICFCVESEDEQRANYEVCRSVASTMS